MHPSYRQDARYLTATKQEQIWLDSFHSTGDIVEATRNAYNVTDETVETYAKSVAARGKIANLINDYTRKTMSNFPTIDELRGLYMDIANAGSATIRERLQALIAYERVSGYSKQKPKEDEGFDPLDDITG
jgi:GTP1/Obg family GTP-binding protein